MELAATNAVDSTVHLGSSMGISDLHIFLYEDHPRAVDRVFHYPANLFKAEAKMGFTECPSSDYKLLLEYEKLTCSWELLSTVDI